MKSSNRIVVNTGILYLKMLLSMALSLLSTRWVLEALGTTDFGIYNLVAGLIAMFAFLNAAMTVSSQRYISYSIGTGDYELLKKTFYYSVVQHIILGLIILTGFEAVGTLFLDKVLDVPVGKEADAQFVLHFLAVGTFLTIITVPYQALANSRENMLVIALIGILESVLKFSSALILLHFSGDRLRLYAILMAGVSLASMLSIRIYCKVKYKESHFKWLKVSDWKYFREFSAYAMWNFFGAFAGIVKSQGIAMILNVFFGVVVNAAYGIATQVNGQLSFLAHTIIRAIQPQLVQSAGSGNIKKMLQLSIIACKFPTLLISFFLIPLIIKMPYVLKLWLNNVPEYSVGFCQIILIITIVYQTFHGLEISIHAVGKIKWYQIVGYSCHLMVIPVGYFFLKFGASVYSVLFLSLGATVFNMFITMYFSRKHTGINLKSFSYTYLIPIYVILSVTCAANWALNIILPDDFIGLALLLAFNIIFLCVTAWFILMDKDEKGYVYSILMKFHIIKKAPLK